MNAIETHNLTKFYGKSLGIKNVNLSINQGEVFGFIGPNGAGKSTAIRTLLGLLRPTSGNAKILNMDIVKQGAKLRRKVGYLPSEVYYYDRMTARKMLEYHCRFYGIRNYDKVDEFAELFELDLEKDISELSFGNRKKCGIIQALIHDPEVLILDEPTSGLDPLMQNVFFNKIEELNKKGTTVFFSSHVLSEVQRICQRAAIIRSGEIVAIEDIQQLLQKQMKLVKVFFHEKPNHFQLPEGAMNHNWLKNRLSFEFLGPTASLISWLAGLDIRDVIISEPDLEALFMNFYER